MPNEMLNLQNGIREVTLIDADTAEAAATSTLEIGEEAKVYNFSTGSEGQLTCTVSHLRSPENYGAGQLSSAVWQ
jgi:hypothetical protein